MGKYDIGPRIGIEGEAEYRAAMSKLNDNIKTHASEMKLLASQYDKSDESIERFTAENDILNKEIAEQKKKIEEINKVLQKSVDKYGESSTQTNSYKRTLNEATAELNKMERQVADNNAKMTTFSDKTEKATVETERFDNANQKVGTTLKVVGAGVVALAAGTGRLLSTAVNNADAWNTQAAIYGLTAEQIQELNYAGTKLDVSLETILGAQTKLTKSMYEAKDGTGEQAEAFKLLNVSVLDANGNLRSAQDVMTEAFSKLQNYGDETERDALAMKIFGKSAMELNPLIKAGGAELQRLTKEARTTGAVISNETVDALDNFGDNTDALKIKLQAAIAKGLTPIVPKIEQLVDKAANANFEPLLNGLGWMIDNSGLIIGGIVGVTSAMATFSAVSAIKAAIDSWRLYKAATEGATIAQWALNSAQWASPAGLLAGIVGLAVGGLTAYELSAKNAAGATDELTDSTEILINDTKDLNKTISENIKEREKHTQDIINENDAYKSMSDELYNLSEKQNKTTEEKAKMVVLVDQLNKALPDLNLHLNTETGALSMQRDEIEKLIAADKKYLLVKAAQSNMIQLTSEKLKQETTIRRLEAERAKKEEEYLVRKAEIEKKYVADIMVKPMLKAARKEMFDELNKEYEEAKTTLGELNEQINDNNSVLQDNIDVLNKDTTAKEKSADASELAAKKAEELKAANEAAAESLRKMQEEYKRSYEEQFKIINDQYGLFDEFTMNTETSGKQLLNNLKTQINGIYTWSENLKSLAKKGVSEGLIKELELMGPKAAGEIAALNQLSEKQLNEYVSLWEYKTRMAMNITYNSLSDQRKAIENMYVNTPMPSLASVDIFGSLKGANRLLNTNLSAAQPASSFDYDRLAKIIVDYSRKQNIKIVYNGDVLGEVIDGRVGRLMYAQ